MDRHSPLPVCSLCSIFGPKRRGKSCLKPSPKGSLPPSRVSSAPMKSFALNASKKTNSTPAGEISVDWACVQFGEVVAFAQYGLSLATHPDGKTPILKMNSMTDGKVTLSDLHNVNCSPDEVAKYAIRHGDILFNRTHSLALVGKTAVVRDDANVVFASCLVRFRLKPVADPRFAAD
jgi:hypothetical protein